MRRAYVINAEFMWMKLTFFEWGEEVMLSQDLRLRSGGHVTAKRKKELCSHGSASLLRVQHIQDANHYNQLVITKNKS